MRLSCAILAVGLSHSLLHSAPVVLEVNNAASGGLNISPGCLISIYGKDLAATTAIAGAGNLPTTLAETSISIAGLAAPLTYVSSTQINAQVPFEVSPGPTTLTVATSQGDSAPIPISLSPTSPGVFQGAVPGQALVLTPAFQVANTIRSGDVIIFYATGLGQTNPPIATGALGATAAPLNKLPKFPTVSIGGNPAKVLFAGIAPGFPVYQINAVVPSLPRNDQIVLTTANNHDDSVSVVFANNNVSNVHASVNLVYPSASSQITFSPIPLLATFSLTLDVSPTAGPFKIRVSIDGSNAASDLTVDPTASTVAVASTTPTAATRQGDFFSSGLSTLDFMTGESFPSNVVPLSRFDPAASIAFNTLPLGNASGSDGSVDVYAFSMAFATGPSFSFASTDPGAQFGGFMATSQDSPSHTINVNAVVVVDGVKVASSTFAVPRI